MNLKITPKEAIQLLDTIAKKGYDLLNLIEQHRLLAILNDRREKQKLKEKTNWDKVNNKGAPIEDNPYAINKSLKLYTAQYSEWHKGAQAVLNSIYKDFIPKFKFKRIEADYSSINDRQTSEFKHFLILISKLENQLNHLAEKYQELITLVKSPLFYLKDTHRIVYYDRIIELKPDNNESLFCSFIFEYPFGQTKTFEEIYAAIQGWDKPKNWRSTIKNTYEAINDKTRDRFGFSIFKTKGKDLVYINLP